jgi:hypothetical protein
MKIVLLSQIVNRGFEEVWLWHRSHTKSAYRFIANDRINEASIPAGRLALTPDKFDTSGADPVGSS